MANRNVKRVPRQQRERYQHARTVNADVLARLVTSGDMIAHLSPALEAADLSLFLILLRDCIDAVGVSEIAEESGLSKMSIYRSVSDSATGDLKLSTLFAVLRALKIRLNVVALF